MKTFLISTQIFYTLTNAIISFLSIALSLFWSYASKIQSNLALISPCDSTLNAIKNSWKSIVSDLSLSKAKKYV